MKNDKPASGTLEIPRRHHGKTLEAPKGGLFSRAASVPPPRPMPAPQTADQTTPQTGDQRQVTGTVRPLSQTTRPSSASATTPVASAPKSTTVSAPSSRPASPRSRPNQTPASGVQWLDDMNSQLEDFKRKVERGEINGPTLNFGALPFMVAGLLVFGVTFHLLVGSVIWFMLGILLWSLSNLLDKYKVEQRQGSEAGQVMSGMLARIHPSWAEPANMRWQLRILSIACGFIWFSTSFWS